MAEYSKIEWCDHTFNPWIGCTKVSTGCANCYAETLNERLKWTEWGPSGERKRTSDANWRRPLAWNNAAENGWFRDLYDESGENVVYRGDLRKRPLSANLGVNIPQKAIKVRPRVFCASLADVFDPAVPEAWREDLFELIYQCQELDWLILTKRPELALDFLGGTSGMGVANLEEGGPYEHVRIGTSAEDQKSWDERVPFVLDYPKNFVSAEPLLGPIEMAEWDGPVPDWVICGGESGPGARPMEAHWAYDLSTQCVEHGVPFFFKQWGGVNKKATGRLLDGEEWSMFPADTYEPCNLTEEIS